MTNLVYFVSSNGLIKIGTTADFDRRIDVLRSQSAAAVTVIGTIQGTSRHERATHDCLGAYRRHGEWFVDCAPLRNVIYTILSHGFEAAGIAVAGDENPPSETVAEAQKLAELIVQHSGLTPHEAEQHFSLPTNSIWSLRYRKPKKINADIYLSLIQVAKMAIEAARSRLLDDGQYVEGLAKIRTFGIDDLEEIETDIARLRARLAGEVTP